MTPTPPSTALSELTAKIGEVVPGVVERCVRKCDKCKMEKMMEGIEDKVCGDAVFPCSGILRRDNNHKHEVRRPITLEDVLRALHESKDNHQHMARRGQMIATMDKWDLGLSLHQQSEETIRFLHSLLVK